MTSTHDDDIRLAVRDRYAEAARAVTPSCCGPATDAIAFGATHYGADQANDVPPAALGASLGCGNPTALAALQPGQVVLDLGSGGGIDVLLSARRVGPTGKAYGLDMTPEMHALALRNQADSGVENAEFLLGTIEEVPLPDQSVDVIISNCVINLSPDKDRVLREAHRVLRPGGLFAVSDVVLRRPLSPELEDLVGLWTGCISGALVDTEYRSKLADAGFVDIEIQTTLVHDRTGLEQLASLVRVGDEFDVDAAIDQLDGVVTNAFVRARRA